MATIRSLASDDNDDDMPLTEATARKGPVPANQSCGRRTQQHDFDGFFELFLLTTESQGIQDNKILDFFFRFFCFLFCHLKCSFLKTTKTREGRYERGFF
jgi:hypothetical protein